MWGTTFFSKIQLGYVPDYSLSWELAVYDVQKGCLWGANEEFIASRQLDNLASCYAALTALIATRQCPHRRGRSIHGRLAFCRGKALEDAEMPFAQLRQDFDVEATPCSEHLGGVARAHQVAAVDGVEVMVRGVERHRQRLGAAGLVERDVGLALDALVDVPVGFAVADEADAGGHDGKVQG